MSFTSEEIYFDNYSPKDITQYSLKLHINTAISIFINALAIYCIIFHSTKYMGGYKWYLLCIQLAAALFDFHLTIIFAPFPIFPIPGLCAGGVLSRRWGYFWGEIFQFVLMHFFLSFIGMSIVWGVLYRYRQISNKMNFMKSKYAVPGMALITVIYPVPSVILLILNIRGESETMEFVRQIAPEMIELYKTESCYAIKYSTIASIYYATAAGSIMLSFGAVVVFSFLTYTTLMNKKESLSVSNFRIQKNLLIALWLQCMPPLIMLVVPTVGLYLMVFLNVKEMKGIELKSLKIKRNIFFSDFANWIPNSNNS